MKNIAYAAPNLATSGPPIVIDPELCIGCNTCVEVCRCHVLLPNRVKGDSPVIMYPDECWLCGCCVEYCKEEGAIRLVHPLSQRVSWKRKDTGEFYRIGMGNQPPPNMKPLAH